MQERLLNFVAAGTGCPGYASRKGTVGRLGIGLAATGGGLSFACPPAPLSATLVMVAYTSRGSYPASINRVAAARQAIVSFVFISSSMKD